MIDKQFSNLRHLCITTYLVYEEVLISFYPRVKGNYIHICKIILFYSIQSHCKNLYLHTYNVHDGSFNRKKKNNFLVRKLGPRA
jgi:hypothetical protein